MGQEATSSLPQGEMKRMGLLHDWAYRIASLPERLLVRVLRVRNRYPPLFVVGAPRSGTTVVYLHLLNRLRFGYFPNLSKRHHRACVTAALVGRILHDHEPTYQSRYGIVAGPMAPSDGWEVFHRWFPRYDLDEPVRESRLHELRNIVRLLELIFDAPFVNKNNHNSVRIPHLERLFPRAYFIHVERDVVETVESLVEARRAKGVPPDEWWGAPPPPHFGHRLEGELERAVAQVWGVRSIIEQSLALVDPSRWCAVSYEAFCATPDHIVDWIRTRYGSHDVAIAPNERPAPLEITASTRSGVSSADTRDRILELVDRYESRARQAP